MNVLNMLGLGEEELKAAKQLIPIMFRKIEAFEKAQYRQIELLEEILKCQKQVK